MRNKSNQIVAVNPMLQPAPAVLEGEYLPPEKALKLEPIPHNDSKALADAVNDLREKQAGEGESDDEVSNLRERVSEIEEKLERLDEVSNLRERVAEIEAKLERLLETWGVPDEEIADKGEGNVANKH